MTNHEAEQEKNRLNQLTHRIIGLCMEVHRELGPGLLESAYEEALAHELTLAGLRFERQRDRPLNYKGVSLDCGYRIDFLVEGEIILELKSVQGLLPVHHAQLLTYLKLERCPIGLLLNFNVPVMKDGVKRVVRGSFFGDGQTPVAGLLSVVFTVLAGALAWGSLRA